MLIALCFFLLLALGQAQEPPQPPPSEWEGTLEATIADDFEHQRSVKQWFDQLPMFTGNTSAFVTQDQFNAGISALSVSLRELLSDTVAPRRYSLDRDPKASVRMSLPAPGLL